MLLLLAAVPLLLLLLLLEVPAALGHICLFSPAQRTPLASRVLTAGAPECFLRTPYCGGVRPTVPSSELVLGDVFAVTLQQNLNHWYPADPGFIDIAIATLAGAESGRESAFSVLRTFSDFPAHEMVSQTNFTVAVRLPMDFGAHERAVLRVRYVSNNPAEVDPKNNTRAIFYNCADVRVVERRPTAAPDAASAARAASASAASDLIPDSLVPVPSLKKNGKIAALSPTGFSCAPPKQFTVHGTTETAFGPVKEMIAYDGVKERVRWTRSGAGMGMPVSKVDLLTFYRDPQHGDNPWDYVVLGEKCLNYGPDKFYPWEYGRSSVMQYEGQRFFQGVSAEVWKIGDLLTFAADTKTCLPVGMEVWAEQKEGHPALTRYTFFSNRTAAVREEDFAVPASCKGAHQQ